MNTGNHVPLTIRDRSRIVAFLWAHSSPTGWLTYDRARALARWLP
jgi:2-hydroxychromene-2-carboxylate isomerase